MKKQTFLCNTCDKAIDLDINPTGITAFPRCIITTNCNGKMSQVKRLLVSEEQYHNVGTSTSTWTQRPLMYTHEQQVARSTWIVNHKLDNVPILNVYTRGLDGTLMPLDKDMYQVNYNNPQQASVTFQRANAGVIQCTLRQSSSSVYKPKVVEVSNSVSLTPNQTLILATKLSSIDDVTLIINSTIEKQVTLFENSDNLLLTPWSGVDFVIINNERYKLFGINMAGLSEAANVVTSFRVSKVNGVDITSKMTFVLLTNSPFEHPTDKNLEAIVDLGDLMKSNQQLLSIVNRVLYCTSSIVKNVYPLIETIE